MPKISVIVTTYNRKEYLTETIQSILNQSYQDFELIVVDNYSNYDFFALMDGFKSEKIISLQNQNNGVIAVNRNIGINQAKGEYIAFCDDDDSWVSEKLQVQIVSLDQNCSDLVYSNTFLMFESGKSVQTNYKPTNTINRLLFTSHITLSSIIVRNSNQLQFNEDIHLTGIEDYALWLKLSMNGFKFNFIQIPLVKYRVLNTSYSNLSRSKNETKIIRLKKSLLNNNTQLIGAAKLFLLFSLIKSYTRYVILMFLNR